MDFDFNDDQQMLRDTVRRWVEKDYAFDRRQRIVEAGGHSAEAWRGLADLGVLGLLVPEAHGGMGFGPVDAMVVMEELGRGLVMEPYAAVALVGATLLNAGDAAVAAPYLSAIADGSGLVVPAVQERGSRYRLAQVEATASAVGDGWQLSGTKTVVPAGAHASAYLVPARTTGATVAAGASPGANDDLAGIAIFVVDKAQPAVTVRAYPTQDGAAAADVTFANASARLLIPAGAGYAALEAAADTGIAALCAEAVGAMDRLVDITVDYMNTRKQFGVTIATFQALRHRIADVKMQLELARSMSYFATLKMGEPAAARRRALSQAKLQLGQSMRFVGQQCIQLHGGIGVTQEYAASHYFKRLTVMELTWGDSLHHLGEVSARMKETAGVFA